MNQHQQSWRYTLPKAALNLTIMALYLLVITIGSWFCFNQYLDDSYVIIRMGHYFVFWIILTLGLALVIAFSTRQYRLAGGMVLLLGILMWHYSPILRPSQAVANADNRQFELRMMSYNVSFVNYQNTQAMANLIRQEAPDVVALQEMEPVIGDPLQNALQADYPYNVATNNVWPTQVIMSRYPLKDHREPAVPLRFHNVTVETPAGDILIWHVHPPPAVFSSAGWYEQRLNLKQVANQIAKSSEPIIVLGDFNSTPLSDNYNLIDEHLTDVHLTVGQGIGFSFPSLERLADGFQPNKVIGVNFSLVRIDHIFVSDHFTPLESYVVSQSAGSDHYPIVARLGL